MKEAETFGTAALVDTRCAVQCLRSASNVLYFPVPKPTSNEAKQREQLFLCEMELMFISVKFIHQQIRSLLNFIKF